MSMTASNRILNDRAPLPMLVRTTIRPNRASAARTKASEMNMTMDQYINWLIATDTGEECPEGMTDAQWMAMKTR